MILVIDNYDSFTFNLVQALQAAGADVQVVRNDAIEIGAQRLYVRLHAYASPSLGPYELLREFRRAGLLPLRPGDQRFTEHHFPLAQ